MIRLGLGLRRSANFLWLRLASAWEKQNRAFWENISVNWENWTSVWEDFK